MDPSEYVQDEAELEDSFEIEEPTLEDIMSDAPVLDLGLDDVFGNDDTI